MSQAAKGSRPQAPQPTLVALHLACPSKSGEWLFHNSLTWLILNYEHNYTLQKVNRSYKSVVADSSLRAAQSARVGKGDARPGAEASTPAGPPAPGRSFSEPGSRHPGTDREDGGGRRGADGALSLYSKAKGRWGEGSLEASLLKLRWTLAFWRAAASRRFEVCEL